MSAREQILTLQECMAQSIIGQSQVVERILLTLLCTVVVEQGTEMSLSCWGDFDALSSML
jgi:hypothetical protein